MTPELERELLRLEQIAERCGVTVAIVRRFVEVGVIEPVEHESPRYEASVTVRVHRALRLRRELGVSLADVALVLDLLERIEVLEARVARLREP
jgi:chaperone modulatory protein CbpM